MAIQLSGSTIIDDSRNIVNAGIITATAIVSTVSTGTAPFTVSSTTKVTNLNADSLDGIDSGSFLRSDAADAKTSGTLTFNDNVIGAFGSSNDWELFHDGTNNYSDLNVGNLYIRDNTTTRFTFERTTGNFTATGNVTGYSDETLKDNVETISDALDKVAQLRGVEYDRNDIEGNPHQIGVIAQEVEKIIPEVVTTHEDGIKSVAYGNLVGLLIEAIKDLKEEVTELKVRLEEIS